MADNSIENYTAAVGQAIKEMALQAKADFDAAKGSDEEAFKAGYLMGFHRVVSLMQQEANLVFSIPMDKIGLDGIDADTDLV